MVLIMKKLEIKNRNCTFIDHFDPTVVDTYKKPITTIYIGGNPGIQIDIDKKFNWFQKKMIKWCFGFEVKENK